MSLLNVSPVDFYEATKACAEGRDWALTQPTMADVWDKCPRLDWLLWIADGLGQRPDDRTLRLFAVWCARNTPLRDGRKTGDLLTDPRSLAALEVAERFAAGTATSEELDAAWDAAWPSAWCATRAAALSAARAAAWNDAWDAARDAARDAACAAWSDEEPAARAAAWDAVRDVQAVYFRTIMPNPFRKEAHP